MRMIAVIAVCLGMAVASAVTLAWNASTDPIVAGYNVYYGGTSGTYTNKVNAGTATSVSINGLVPGATYYFAATTYSASGVESPFSSELVYRVRTNAVATATNRIITVTGRLVQITTATNIAGPWLVMTDSYFSPPLVVAQMTNPPEPARFWRGVVVLDIAQTNK